MEKKSKEIIRDILHEIGPVLLENLVNGKTKLGVYLIGIFSLSMNFFYGAEIDTALAECAKIEISQAVGKMPRTMKAIAGAGVAALSIGVLHDLVKRTKGGFGLFKNITRRIKETF